MTREEALQQAADEILKRERQEIAKNELANAINKETTNQVNVQREQRLKDLREQQEAYEKVYKKENPAFTKEINDILGLGKKEEVNKSSLDNVMNKIAISNKVDEIRASFTDEASFNVFNRGVKEVGAESFLEAFEKAGNNVFQALADVNGCKDILELGERDRLQDKELMDAIDQDKEILKIEKIARRVAEILKTQK